jgi:hypothetical protein
MIDKLFGKVRSWLHIDQSVSVATSSPNASGTLAGPSLPRNDSDSGRPANGGKKNKGKKNKGKNKAQNVRVREAARPEAAAVERKIERSADASAAKVDASPPPSSNEAFSRTMDGQPESGMVIGESGIIIIDEPHSPGPASGEGKVVARSPSSDSWALPNLKELPPTAPPTPAAKAGALSDDWDQVLARARAQLNTPHKDK